MSRSILHILRSQGFDTTGLNVLVTDGASMAMEIIMLVCMVVQAKRNALFDVQPILYKL